MVFVYDGPTRATARWVIVDWFDGETVDDVYTSMCKAVDKRYVRIVCPD
jgi:hypothetical protein